MNISSNIYINVPEMEQKIQSLKEEKRKLETVFQNIKNDASGMINYWYGNSGEHAYRSFNAYTKKFSAILNDMQSYITFLESTVAAYKIMEQTINQKIDESSSISIM